MRMKAGPATPRERVYPEVTGRGESLSYFPSEKHVAANMNGNSKHKVMITGTNTSSNRTEPNKDV